MQYKNHNLTSVICLHTSCCIVICWFMQKYTYIYWIHTDAMITTDARKDKDAGRLFYKYIYLSLFCKGSKRVTQVCVWEGAGDRTETAIFWPSLLWPSRCVFLVLLMLNRRSRGPLCRVMASFTASYQQLLWSTNSIGVPEGPLSRVWLSLPHLVSLRLELELAWLLSWLSYIIVQRPLDRSLDLWNRMFNRHQAEITVMQFRGHSLPVRQSMRVSWDF